MKKHIIFLSVTIILTIILYFVQSHYERTEKILLHCLGDVTRIGECTKALND